MYIYIYLLGCFISRPNHFPLCYYFWWLYNELPSETQENQKCLSPIQVTFPKKNIFDKIWKIQKVEPKIMHLWRYLWNWSKSRFLSHNCLILRFRKKKKMDHKLELELLFLAFSPLVNFFFLVSVLKPRTLKADFRGNGKKFS